MNRFAYAIFADDIRHEIGNKRSIIGIYTAKMFVPGFPVLLPRLCISITIITPITRPFKSATIKVLADEKVLAEYPLDDALIAQQQTVPPDEENPDDNFVIQAGAEMQISPFPIEKPSILRVRVITEDEELKAGAISIELASK